MPKNLTFNADFTLQMVAVPIIDDDIVEHSEVIDLTLVSTDSDVTLNTLTSTITIEDVDSKLLYVDHCIYACRHHCNSFIFTTSVVTIGFNKTAYSVSEDAGSVSVTVSVQTGTLDRDVIVTLSSISGTAMCKYVATGTPQP